MSLRWQDAGDEAPEAHPERRRGLRGDRSRRVDRAARRRPQGAADRLLARRLQVLPRHDEEHAAARASRVGYPRAAGVPFESIYDTPRE